LNRPEMPKNKPSQVTIGVVIAIVAALLSPIFMGLSTTTIVFTIINAYLFAFSGLKVAFAAILLDVLAFGIIFGTPGAIVAMLGIALPSAVIIRNVYWRRNYFTQLANGIAANILGVLAALAAARIAIGSDVIGALVEKMRSLVEMLEPGVIDYILDLMYKIEAVPDKLTEEQLINGVLDAARRANYLDGYAVTLSASLRLMLPGYLLSSACLTGFAATAISASIYEARLPMPGSYIRLGRLYTPWWISLGVLGTWAVAWLLTRLGLESGDAVQLTMQHLMILIFRVQTVISMERRLIQMNMRNALRKIIIFAFQLFMPVDIITYYGAFSALFGTTGASLQLQARRMAKKKDE